MHPLDRKPAWTRPDLMGPELLTAIRRHREAIEAAGQLRVHEDDTRIARAKHEADRRLWMLLDRWE